MHYNYYPVDISDSVSHTPYNSPYPQLDEPEPLAGVKAVYDGSISSSVLNFFSGYYRTHYKGDSYLVLRDGQYTYRMYVGSIVSDGKTCIVSNCDVVTYHSNGSSYDYTPYYTVASGVSDTIDISSGNQLSAYVYSDVVGSGVPDIESYNMQYYTLAFVGVTAVIACCACLFTIIRGWLTRHDRRD